MASHARTEFLSRISGYDRAAQLPSLRTTVLNPLRDPARLLRNGLMIVGFATLEDFVRTRTEELLATIRGRTAKFEDLPDGFRAATTESVVRAIPSMLPIWKRSGTVLDEIQNIGRSLASTDGTPYHLSSLGLYAFRNVSAEDVSSALKTFGVPNGWTQIDSLAGRCGLPALALSSAYRNYHDHRNSSAHQATFNMSQADLQGFTMQAIAIALAYDALLSRAARLLAAGVMTASSGLTIGATDIAVRFMDQAVGAWQEVPEGSPPVATAPRLTDVKSAARARARASRELLVVRPTTRLQIRWETTDAG